MESSSMDVVYGHVSHLPQSTLKQARWKTMSGLELSGYAHVKVPFRDRKFGLWKAWNRQWCVIGRNGNTVSLQIGDRSNAIFCVVMPEDVILCRTESRSKVYAFGIFQPNRKNKEAYLYLAGESETESQKWMSNIRCLLKPPLQPGGNEDEFEISLIDNKHSRHAGLTGLYGNLTVSSNEVTIRDPCTGKIKVTWHWSQINHSSLPLPANPEDVHRVCTVFTTSKFKGGEGELEIFCMRADKLHEKLTVYSRLTNIPKIITTPLPPTPEPPEPSLRSRVNTSPSSNCLATPPHPMLLASRRMSRSENDLQTIFFGRTLNNLRENVGSQDVLLISSNENVASIKKVPSLIFANIGFIISTPGCSVPGSMNDLHRISDTCQINDSFNKSLPDKIEYDMIDEKKGDEIEDDKIRHLRSQIQKHDSNTSLNSGDYEQILLPHGEYDEEYKSYDIPPPLPPRKTSNNSPPAEKITHKEKRISKGSQEYLPMTPNTTKRFDRPKYMPMANLKDKILVSDPIPI